MTKSTETKSILINLALAVADALECPETPASLMDALSEIGSGLIDQLSGEKIAPHLRALARVHTESPEIEKALTAHSGARNGAQNQGRQARAIH